MRSALVAMALVLAFPALAQDAPMTAVADLRPNAEVTVAGTVLRITDDDEFILGDATGEVQVYLSSGSMPVQPDQAVTVMGRVDDDGPIELYARTLILPDGTVLTFAPDW